MIKRVAMWRLKESEKEEKLLAMKDALLSLYGRVPSLKAIEVGLNISCSHAAFDVVFIGSFADIEGLKSFELDPIHKEVAAFVSSMRDVRVVVDYEVA